MPTDKTELTKEGLDNFSFDTEQTFFGVPGTGPQDNEEDETAEVIAKVKTEGSELEEDDNDEPTVLDDKAKTKKKEGDKKVVDKKKEEELEFFEDEDKTKKKKDGEEEGEETPETEEKPDDKFFKTLASEMKEKGIFQNVELDPEKDYTEEEFFEMQDKEIEARVDETFEQFFEEMSQDGKDFLKFVKDGGKPGEFIATYQQDIPLETLDADDEDQRNAVLAHYLTTVENMDKDDVADRIKWLNNNGKAKANAEKYFAKMKESEKTNREALVLKQKTIAEKRVKDGEAFTTGLKEVLAKTESVRDIPITKEEQKTLADYITKPTVKVGKNRYVPEMQTEIARMFKAETPEDKADLLLLAKFLKNKFDTSDITVKAQTTIVQTAKSKLRGAKEGVNTKTSGSYSGKKSLTDYFN